MFRISQRGPTFGVPLTKKGARWTGILAATTDPVKVVNPGLRMLLLVEELASLGFVDLGVVLVSMKIFSCWQWSVWQP